MPGIGAKALYCSSADVASPRWTATSARPTLAIVALLIIPGYLGCHRQRYHISRSGDTDGRVFQNPTDVHPALNHVAYLVIQDRQVGIRLRGLHSERHTTL